VSTTPPGTPNPAPSVAYYDAQYAHIAAEVNTEVRRETWGEDIGQNSWLTVDEFRRFIGWMELGPQTHALDVGCGSGRPAIFLSETTGSRVTGIDLNESGIAAANRVAAERGLQERVRFEHADASRSLAFPDRTFDAVYCIDAINHLADRPKVLSEWARALRPGGRLLFTDPITVTGILGNDEIAVRSSIAYFMFTPEGVNERLIDAAGFQVIRREDVTENVATVARRFHAARARHREALTGIEGAKTFEGTQTFLWMAYVLAAERRLSRFVFLARKP
jgi:SAM-dependent methyltransferase